MLINKKAVQSVNSSPSPSRRDQVDGCWGKDSAWGTHSVWERWIKNWPLFTFAIEPEIDSRTIIITRGTVANWKLSLSLSCSLSPVVAWFLKFNAVQYIQIMTKIRLKTYSLLKQNYFFLILNSLAYIVAFSTIFTIVRVHAWCNQHWNTHQTCQFEGA